MSPANKNVCIILLTAFLAATVISFGGVASIHYALSNDKEHVSKMTEATKGTEVITATTEEMPTLTRNIDDDLLINRVMDRIHSFETYEMSSLAQQMDKHMSRVEDLFKTIVDTELNEAVKVKSKKVGHKHHHKKHHRGQSGTTTPPL